MTASLERKPPHDPSRRIGEFYLRGFLSDSDGKIDVNGKLELQDAMRKMSREAGVGLPPSLIERLSLKKLAWKEVGDYYDLPFVLAGFPDHKQTSLNTALATIEVARKTKKPSKSGVRQTEPLLLRIAGVHHDETTGDKRVVAATYYLKENGRLTNLDVSVRKDEYPQEPAEEIAGNGDNQPHGYDPQKIMVDLPSDRKQPYGTAALVTQGMVNAIRTDESSLRALSVKLNSKGDVFFGPPYFDKPDFSGATGRLGYNAKIENGLITVGLTVTGEGAEKRGLTPWQISIPASLPKILN